MPASPEPYARDDFPPQIRNVPEPRPAHGEYPDGPRQRLEVIKARAEAAAQGIPPQDAEDLRAQLAAEKREVATLKRQMAAIEKILQATGEAETDSEVPVRPALYVVPKYHAG